MKPFGMMEMVSSVKAVLRRNQPKKNDRLLQLDELVVDMDQHTVSISGERIALTYTSSSETALSPGQRSSVW